MKKISLKNLEANEAEKLSLSQLKDVFGGGDNQLNVYNPDVCYNIGDGCVTDTSASGICYYERGQLICIEK